MKFVLKCCFVSLLATCALAQTAATKPRKKVVRKPVEPAVTMQDVQSLKDALAAQQQQIEQLKQDLQQRDQAQQQTQQQLQAAQAAASDAQQKAAAVQATTDQQQQSVSKLSGDMADVRTTLTNNAVGTQDEQKRVSGLESALGRFRFTGDIRVRGESFFQDRVADRNRARIRVRFGVEGKLGEDFLGGFALATGSLGDPTSTNTTLTNFFDKHTIGLDKGYITYNPIAAKWLSLTGGKFAYTWQRTPVTFDSDLNPEGFSQKLSWDLHNPFVKNFTLMGMQLVYNESGGGTDSYATGGQVATKLQMGPWTATPSFTILKWNNIDALLNASLFSVQGTSGSGTVPGSDPPVTVTIPLPGEGPGCSAGFPSTVCAFAANRMTNGTFIDAGGKGHFLSQYMYADFIVNNVIKTGIAKLPLNILAEYEQNLDAASHPVDSTGAVMTDVGSQNKAYTFDVSMGQAKNKNDIQFGYSWLRQEQDSVLASFSESDLRAPTNVLQNRFYGTWKIRNNTLASFTYWYGHTLNTSLINALRSTGVPVGGKDANLSRLQFDLIYSF